MILGEGVHGPIDRRRRPLHRRVSARDQAVRRLSRVNRAVTASAVAGAGLFALVAARTAPGRSISHVTSAAASPPASPAPAPGTTAPAAPLTTIAPVTAAAPTTAAAHRSRTVATTALHGAAVVTSPPTTARPVRRPVPTTAAPVVVSGGS
jgi:hypothetical protein